MFHNAFSRSLFRFALGIKGEVFECENNFDDLHINGTDNDGGGGIVRGRELHLTPWWIYSQPCRKKN